VTDHPDLLGRKGRRWRWDQQRQGYILDSQRDVHLADGNLLRPVAFSRPSLEALHGPLSEAPPDPWLEEIRSLAEDFMQAADFRRQGLLAQTIDLLVPADRGDAETHRRLHMVTACGAVLTGAAVKAHMGEYPTAVPGHFYSFELEADGPEGPAEVAPDKLLAARLLTAGANLDMPLIRDLIVASCSVARDHSCELVVSTLMELLQIFVALDPTQEQEGGDSG
jgi:hypothetical protein